MRAAVLQVPRASHGVAQRPHPAGLSPAGPGCGASSCQIQRSRHKGRATHTGRDTARHGLVWNAREPLLVVLEARVGLAELLLHAGDSLLHRDSGWCHSFRNVATGIKECGIEPNVNCNLMAADSMAQTVLLLPAWLSRRALAAESSWATRTIARVSSSCRFLRAVSTAPRSRSASSSRESAAHISARVGRVEVAAASAGDAPAAA